MMHRTIAILSFGILGACGGGSTGANAPVVVPLSPSGFASDEVTLRTITTLNLTDQTRTVSEGGEELSFVVQDLVIDDFNDQDGELFLTIDGETFTLTLDADDTDRLFFEDDDTFISLRTQISDNPDATVASLFAVIDGNLNSSYLLIGVDTDPAVIGMRSGSAAFEGLIRLTTRTGFTDGFGSGRIELDVDFNDLTLGGDLFVFDDGGDNPETRVPSIAFDIVQTDITGNGFETTLEYDAAASLDKLDGTVVSTGLTGRFFGTEGATVGGQLFGQIDNGPDAFPTLIEGAYVAAE